MRTYFVKTCVYAFSDVCRRWLRKRRAEEFPTDVLDAKIDLKQDTAQTAEHRFLLEEIWSAAEEENLLDVLEARCDGKTYAEIARRHGVTGSAIEGKLRRLRNRFKRGNV
jgi:DNA-directed RNA polymerase specialized sigma24 family protein